MKLGLKKLVCGLALALAASADVAMDVGADGKVVPVELASDALAGAAREEAQEDGTKDDDQTLAAIDAELHGVEDLIAAQQHKIGMLQTLRREYLTGAR